MFKKAYYAVVFDENTNVYASKTCKTRIGRWLFIQFVKRELRKKQRCLKLGI